MSQLLCKRCDVYVGYGGAGVVRIPEQYRDRPNWLATHCWVCFRSAEEIQREQDRELLFQTAPELRDPANLERLRKFVTGEDAACCWCQGTVSEHEPTCVLEESKPTPYQESKVNDRYGDPSGESEPTTAITRYVDKAMFEAEPVEEAALERPRVHLLSATPDPLGAVAAFAMMYEGRVVRDLAEITDDERRRYFDDCFKTALRTPLEAIDLHFLVEGMTRATFDQMRTQRTAVFAGESLRFAVKEEIVNRPGPGVAGKRRVAIWEDAIEHIHEAYLALIADGVPAEDARGLLPLNVLTRAHYKTNLRNLESEVGKRLCTQAQFEWRLLHADLRREIREYGRGFYAKPWPGKPFTGEESSYQMGPSRWQFEHIADSPMFQPICFQKGACMFKAKMDRGCTIRERVDRGAFNEIKTEEWLADPTAAWIR